MPDFPSVRFTGAGASEDELGRLVSEFEHSDLSVQMSQADYYAGVSEGDLREYLMRLREAGHFAPDPAADELEAAYAESEPDLRPITPAAPESPQNPSQRVSVTGGEPDEVDSEEE